MLQPSFENWFLASPFSFLVNAALFLFFNLTSISFLLCTELSHKKRMLFLNAAILLKKRFSLKCLSTLQGVSVSCAAATKNE